MKRLAKSFTHYYQRVTNLLSVPRNRFLPEHFHRLRVNIKKINALMVLTADCVDSLKPKKTIRPLRMIFIQAGKVREIQLQIKFLQSFGHLHGILPYLKFLRKELSTEKEKFFSMAAVPLSFKAGSITKAMGKAGKKEVLHYLNKKEKRIKKHFHLVRMNKDKLHNLRIELKRWIYCMESLQLPLSGKYLILAEDLGKWHDCYVNQQQISTAMNYDRLPMETIRSFNILQNELRLKEKKILTDIHQNIALLKNQKKQLAETNLTR